MTKKKKGRAQSDANSSKLPPSMPITPKKAAASTQSNNRLGTIEPHQRSSTSAGGSPSAKPAPSPGSPSTMVGRHIASRQSYHGTPPPAFAQRHSQTPVSPSAPGVSPRGPRRRPLPAQSSPQNTRIPQKLDLPVTIPPPRSSIEYSEEYLSRAKNFIASEDMLERNGYIIRPFSNAQLEFKKRCAVCGKFMAKPPKPPKSPKPRPSKPKSSLKAVSASDNTADAEDKKAASEKSEKKAAEDGVSNVEDRESALKKDSKESTKESPTPRKPSLHCRYHTGHVISKKWTCCGNHVSSDPCNGSENHVPCQYQDGALEAQWQFYPTPDPQPASYRRAAVAIDCEMGAAESGDSELIRVTLVDYFSSETLIDSLVYPDVPMLHYNTRFSGVSRKDMDIALKTGNYIKGRANALMAIWQFVGPQTIVVAHSGNNDLSSLRWIHPTMFDTHLVEFLVAKAVKDKEEQEKQQREALEQERFEQMTELEKLEFLQLKEKELEREKEKEPVEPAKPATPPSGAQEKPADGRKQPKRRKPKGSGALSLKTLTREKLGRDIQMAGNKGHDSLEDAIAARDVAHWIVMNRSGWRGLGVRE